MYPELYATAGITRADQAYGELKSRLLAGEFAVNLRLGEERLASLLGVSRTPIREALLRLHTEGLVDRWPDGGFRPTVPDVAVMRDIYEVRFALEVAALRRPETLDSTHDHHRLLALREDWATLHEDAGHEPDPAFVGLDESFHLALAEAAGNQVLVEQLKMLNDRIRPVRTQDFLVEGRIATTISEHLEIVEVLLSGDREGAETLLLAHIGLSVAVIEHRVQRVVNRMVAGADGP